MNIEISVDKLIVKPKTDRLVIGGSNNFVFAVFRFDGDWDGLSKTVTFYTNNAAFDVLLTSDTCEVPHELLLGGNEIFITASGYGDRTIRTKSMLSGIKVYSEGTHQGTTPGAYTPELWEQAIAQINLKQDKAITDEGAYYNSDTVEGAFQEIGEELSKATHIYLIDGLKSGYFDGTETPDDETLKYIKGLFDEMLAEENPFDVLGKVDGYTYQSQTQNTISRFIVNLIHTSDSCYLRIMSTKSNGAIGFSVVPYLSIPTSLAELTEDEDNRVVTDAEKAAWNNKQDKIDDLEAIRSGAAAGAKAIPAEQKGVAKGVAELDENGKVPSAQLPSYVDDVLEYTNQSAFPSEGESGKIYIAQDTNKTYRWGGTAYAEISASLALGETSSTAYRGDKGKAAYEHSQKTSGNPHGVTKADIGLNNVDNTSDLDKPVSVSQKAAIDAKYTKPTGGIPKADLAEDVQTSLGKADSALQSHQDISGKVDKVEGKELSTNDYTNTDKSKVDSIDEIKSNLASLTLGIHTDGLIYIFNNGKPIGTGIEMVGGASGDVVGFVDAENNIVITGSLPKGAYTLKYEMEDGSLVDVGIIDLTSGTSSYTNLADPNSEDWLTDMRLATSYGYGKANVGSIFTNYIPAQRGDVLRVKGLNLFGKANSQHSAIAIYSSEDKTANESGKYNAYHGFTYTDMTSDLSGEGAKDDISFNNDIYTYTILLHGGAQTITGATINYVRISAPLADGYTSNDVIITVNEEIV